MTPRPPAPADYAGCPVTVTEAIAAGRSVVPVRWGLWDVAVALGLTAVAIAVVGVVAALAESMLDLNLPEGPMVIVGVLLPWVGLGGWPLIATAWRGNGPRIDLGLQLTWRQAAWGAGAGLVALMLAGLAAAVTTRFDPEVSSSAQDVAKELLDTSSRPVVIAFALLIMVGAPVVEELFFRGLLFASLRKRGWSAAWTVIVTGVAFAAFHFEPARFLILLPTGLILGWVRSRTGSTGTSMLAHGIVNAPGAIVLLVGAAGMTP